MFGFWLIGLLFWNYCMMGQISQKQDLCKHT